MTSGARPPARARPLGDPEPTHPDHLRPDGTPPRRAVTDALLLAAGRGDLDAFAAFYDSTAPLVVALLHGVLDAPARAEEMIEAVYLAVWRAAPGFDPLVGSADTTLLRAARRALVGPVGLLTSAGSGSPASGQPGNDDHRRREDA